MEVKVEVAGLLPPLKGEAKTMLAQRHPQGPQVWRLLEAASLAIEVTALLAGDIELEVTVFAPVEYRRPDATKMLGGIGDVFQTRPTSANVDHLGAPARVACFQDHSAAKEVADVPRGR